MQKWIDVRLTCTCNAWVNKEWRTLTTTTTTHYFFFVSSGFHLWCWGEASSTCCSWSMMETTAWSIQRGGCCCVWSVPRRGNFCCAHLIRRKKKNKITRKTKKTSVKYEKKKEKRCYPCLLFCMWIKNGGNYNIKQVTYRAFSTNNKIKCISDITLIKNNVICLILPERKQIR